MKKWIRRVCWATLLFGVLSFLIVAWLDSMVAGAALTTVVGFFAVIICESQ